MWYTCFIRQDWFFQSFLISLTQDSCMQRKGVPMLYERSATVLLTLYVCPVENVLGIVPLIPCYFNGNTHNMIPHKYREAIPAETAANSTRQWNRKSSFSRSTSGCVNISTQDSCGWLCTIVQEATCRQQDTCSSNHEAQAWGTSNCQGPEQWLIMIVEVKQV